jgi:uncharacterized protein (DUF849 family)
MMQCALNGDFGPRDHPEVPVTLEELVRDARARWEAGAALVRLHPRRASDGAESLAADTHDAVVAAVREAAPGLEISCSTQEDIDTGDAADCLEDTLFDRDGTRAPSHPEQVAQISARRPGQTFA